MSDIPLLNGLLYCIAGILVFAGAFTVLTKAWPIDLWHEIRERNVAAAILAGAVALGICWIVAASMH